MMGSVFQNRAFVLLSTLLPNAPTQDIRQALAGTSSTLFQSLDGTERIATTNAIIIVLSSVWAILLAASALSFIFSLFLSVSRWIPSQWMMLLMQTNRFSPSSEKNTKMHVNTYEARPHANLLATWARYELAGASRRGFNLKGLSEGWRVGTFTKVDTIRLLRKR